MRTYADTRCKNCSNTYKPRKLKQSSNPKPSSPLKYCSRECELTMNRNKEREKQKIAFENGEYTGKSQYFKLRFLVFRRDKFCCRYCGRNPSNGAILHIDHVIPKSKGGKLAMDNLVTACSECNIGKSDILLTERDIQNIAP